jgi:hypothetical protein
MDEGAELATAGLVVAFAAVLLVVAHFFMEAQSAKRVIDGSMNLKARANIADVRL